VSTDDPFRELRQSETYEQACARTGRKWPYRTQDWPCPACGKSECDLDVEFSHPPIGPPGARQFFYQHKRPAAEGRLHAN
jgi:hypothetical protein